MKNWLKSDLNNQGFFARVFGYFLRSPHQQVAPRIAQEQARETSTTNILATSAVNPLNSTTREMHLSRSLQAIRQLSSAPRVPVIKFLGHHGEVPRYDPNATQPRGSLPSRGAHITIDEIDLPARLRRHLPSPEEIAMVNSGGLREM